MVPQAELDTFPKLARRNSQIWGNEIAFRKKEYGVWNSHTWKEYYDNAKYFSLGLISLGLERGDKVSIVGDSDPDWYIAELAVHAAGGVVVGLYPTVLPDEIKWYAEHSDSKFIVAQDQEQLDKVLEVKNELPLLKKVIYWDPKGIHNYQEPIIISFQAVQELGRNMAASDPELFERNIDQGTSQDICFILYTSGTSALPKGALASYEDRLIASRLTTDVFTWQRTDETVSYLPPAWAAAQLHDYASHIRMGSRLNFAETQELLPENIKEISPHFLMYGARYWNDVASSIQARINDATPLKRFAYRNLLPIGYKVADLKLQKKQVNIFWQILYSIAYLFMFRPIRDTFGLKRLRHCITGGTSLSPDCLRMMHALGINLRQVYGLTEIPIITAHRDGDVKLDSVGPQNVEDLKITPEGEIIVKWPYFRGYYKNQQATDETYQDGWFHTKDAGYIDDDGHLIYWDRLADLRQLPNGKKFSPAYIESRLMFSPYIKDAVSLGGSSKSYVTALISIDYQNVGKWAEANNISYTTYADLSQKSAVYQLIADEISKLNANLPEWSKVQRFANLYKELDPDEQELTRTGKLRRNFVENRYVCLIDALYNKEKRQIAIETEFAYRDGRTAMMRIPVTVFTIESSKP